MSALTSTAAPPDHAGDEIAAGLWAAITSEFLQLVNWSAQRRVLSFPQGHPVLGWRLCSVANCDGRAKGLATFCPSCWVRWKECDQPPVAEFIAIERIRLRQMQVGNCTVPQCQRPWKTSTLALCTTHIWQRDNIFKLSLSEFVAHPDVVGLPSFGPCVVAACTRDRGGHGPYCHTHTQRWRNSRSSGVDEHHWRLIAPAIPIGGEASLRGLHERVVAEMLFGLQQRIERGTKTTTETFRPLADHARVEQVGSLNEIDPDKLSTRLVRGTHKSFVNSAQLLRATPETERLKDEWDAAVFGHSGTLRFTEISQPWLREAMKVWTYNDIPRRRGKQVKATCQTKINSMVTLSASLRLQHPDHGCDPVGLSRNDITAFLNRQAFLHAEGTISARQRIIQIRDIRQILTEMRALALTRPGQLMHGLPEDFTISEGDIPDEPEDTEAGRDLPTEVMRELCRNLKQLENESGREVRVASELLIDTGRRPNEICELPLDCLERDQGKPVLVYDNQKANRLARRLPINSATAALVEEQQQHVRNRFPNEPIGQLVLLPRANTNPNGTQPISVGTVNMGHRRWVDGLPEFLVLASEHIDGEPVKRMLPFDKKRIFPYAYRHTWAQRHADAGVAVETLSELMDHRQLSTTQGYFRVGEERRREAVDRVTALQFDRHGSRIWRQAKALLDSEHLRRAWVKSRSPTALAVSLATLPRAGMIARSGSDVLAARTFRPTFPICRIWRHICRICCAAGNGCAALSTRPTIGPRPKPCRRTRRSPASGV
ncbi:tyrosine-type recombinase/integrase [Nocardia altamirensis]|uniref:tyrosine-type recombinase/integrase n=1 Tax=Nocardia altamirensis TaxID=472158 RepID=UPI000B25206F|nr:site-specific integrase [Nocardia altamirensis]